MKKIVLGVVALLIIPFSVGAAPLTETQARSLIEVVQSSPETHASAFTDLITAFSNITVKQAESLITVVQSAPGVKPDAFVEMLLAFTIDPVLPQTSQLEQKIDTLTQKVDSLGSTPQPIPSVIIEPMQPPTPTELLITFAGGSKADANAGFPLGSFNWRVSVLDQNGNYLENQPVSVNFPDDARFPRNENLTLEEDKATSPNFHKETVAQSGFKTKDWGTSFEYIPTTAGQKTITFTSGNLTKTIEVTVE